MVRLGRSISKVVSGPTAHTPTQSSCQNTRAHISLSSPHPVCFNTESETTESEIVRISRLGVPLVALVPSHASPVRRVPRGCGSHAHAPRSAQAHADQSPDGNASGRNGEHRERARSGRERRRRRRRRLDRASRAVGLGLAGVAVEASLLVQVAVRADALVVDVEVRVRLAWLG